MRRRRQQIEASIEGKESERASLATEMNDPNFYLNRKDADELIARYQQLGREIERLYADLEKTRNRGRRTSRMTFLYPVKSRPLFLLM